MSKIYFEVLRSRMVDSDAATSSSKSGWLCGGFDPVLAFNYLRLLGGRDDA